MKEKITESTSHLPWLSHYFSEVRVTFLEMQPEIRYYIRGTTLNIFCSKSGPNVFWLMIMASCREYEYTFLMEADWIPVRPGWLDALEVAATDCPTGTWTIGASYHGPTRTAAVNAFHINGNAIYATGDREFQDFLDGDLVAALEWMAESISNGIAYDAAFSLGIHNYQEVLEKVGVDLRKYIWRSSFSPVIRNISAEVETESNDAIDIMLEVRSDVCDVHLSWPTGAPLAEISIFNQWILFTPNATRLSASYIY